MSDSPWTVASIKASQPKRGPGSQADAQFQAKAISLSWGWGSQPSRAVLTIVSADDTYPALTAGAYLEMTLFGRTFYGLAQSGSALSNGTIAQPTARASSGRTLTVEFSDTREYLKWDRVYCAFNMPDTRIVDGVRVRRYWHILPNNFKPYLKTYTNAPLSAEVILNFIFAAGTLGTAWNRVYHPDQVNYPVLNVDSLSGRRLDDVLQEITEDQGLVFGLQGGPFTLAWVRKGEGQVPVFPPRTDDQTLATALSGQGTRVFVIGDRNLYTVLDIPMVPDWNRNWDAFWDPAIFAFDIFNRCSIPGTGTPYNAIPGDDEQYQGHQLAEARAREISVAEYAALRGDMDFRDFRFYSNRSRMQVPAWIYIRDLVFRAFRPPPILTVNGIQGSIDSMEMVETLPARVTHDAVTGKMTAFLDFAVDGNGLAIAQGYNVGSDLFKSILPERFNLDQWLSQQELWQSVPFTIDQSNDNGRFIIFESPMIKTADLIQVSDSGFASLNAAAKIQPPAVRAALSFEWDKFTLAFGSGSMDEVVNQSGLRAEYIVSATSVVEVPYADGQLAAQKAAILAAPILSRPYWFYQGGYRYKLQPEDALPELNGIITRISLEYSDQGYVCTVEWTTDRPERFRRRGVEFDRIARSGSLLPGQAELRAEARQMRLVATALRQAGAVRKSAGEALRGRLGVVEPLHKYAVESGTGTLSVGTPLWKKPATNTEAGPRNTRAVMPAASTGEHSVFAGVTPRGNEDATRQIDLQQNGQMLVRAQGPVAVGDRLVQSAGNDYLQSGGSESPGVGEAQCEVPAGATQLIPMISSGAGGGGKSVSIPEWTKDRDWTKGDFTVRSLHAAVDDGRQSGTWEATENIFQGTDNAGPSLDNPKWRLVAPHAQPRQTWRSQDRVGILDTGRDDGFPPSFYLLQHKDDLVKDVEDDMTGPGMIMRLSELNGGIARFREFEFCIDNVPYSAFFMMTKPQPR